MKGGHLCYSKAADSDWFLKYDNILPKYEIKKQQTITVMS